MPVHRPHPCASTTTAWSRCAGPRCLRHWMASHSKAGPAWRSAPARPSRWARPRAAPAPISQSRAASTCRPSSAPARPIASGRSAGPGESRSRRGSTCPSARMAAQARRGAGPRPMPRPRFPEDRIWSVEAVPGPREDWIDEAGHARFLTGDWRVSAHSNRVGVRLEGPDWTFTRRAYDKSPENGTHPSNIIEHGYGLGSINLCGQTPIVLGPDGLTLGGFINPYTVPTGSLWKPGQARPGDIFRFVAVGVREAQEAPRRARCPRRRTRSHRGDRRLAAQPSNRPGPLCRSIGTRVRCAAARNRGGRRPTPHAGQGGSTPWNERRGIRITSASRT